MNNKYLTSKILSISEERRSKFALSRMPPIEEMPNENGVPVAAGDSAYHVGESRPSLVSEAHDWTSEYSKINFLSKALTTSTLDKQSVLSGLGRYFNKQRASIATTATDDVSTKSDADIREQFPLHMTCLMNEGNHWGCFYNFPELYSDAFSPTVRIRNLEDVPELIGGELTKDMVAACLSYLKRTPILGDLVYIKLDLASKHLQNIDVLANYKFLVYLDLSSNLLTSLTVLSSLPYLQFLTVAFNRLSTVLEYEPAQWFLTEVRYKYNSVNKIRDLTMFWSLTVLDLSHNNIKTISGLENLEWLRRLDLSFNHIQRLENLNNLRLLWLDVSYNNISTCEYSQTTGLWTLLHLEYLNLNENNLTSMKMFAFCTRLHELHVRNNRLSVMLELPVYMRQLRRLHVLDLRANPICNAPAYKMVIINTFPSLINLDACDLDPVDQRTLIMETRPDITMHTTRKLLRLLYIEQLSKARVSAYIPPADTTDVPIVVLVGHEGVGKGTLSRRLAKECSSHIKLARQHTTAMFHFLDHYIEITRQKFDDMLLAGDFLTYSEVDGESYGLSREEAFVTEGKVKVVCLDLPAALMLKLRGYRPYLILATRIDIEALTKIQEIRKAHRIKCNRERWFLEPPTEHTTLQVMLSGRIIITGIINEIIMGLPEGTGLSEFTMESECSLMLDSDIRQALNETRGYNILALLNSSTSSIDEAINKHAQDIEERSLYSLFKGSQCTAENASDVGQHHFRENRYSKYTDKHSNLSHRFLPGKVTSKSTANSKSVTFTNKGQGDIEQDVSGMMIEPEKTGESESQLKSISTKVPWAQPGWQSRLGSHVSLDESDLWLAFLTDAGYLQNSDTDAYKSESCDVYRSIRLDDDIIRQINNSQYTSNPHMALGLRDPYEHIHRHCPGLFWDTVAMDDPEEAFIIVRKIIRNIVNSQKKLKPMFDINFAHLSDYPTVEKKLNKIRKQIAPQQLFY